MRQAWLIVGSIGVHLGLGVSSGLIPKTVARTPVAISLAPAKKPEPKKETPPPTTEIAKPQPVTRPDTRWKAPSRATEAEPAAAQGKPEAAASQPSLTPAFDAFADIGVSLGGTSGGGMAVPTGPSSPRSDGGPRSQEVAHKTRTLSTQNAAANECSEPLVKPVPESMSQPSYTAQAREAGIEGKVRIEVTVDSNGRVRSARVLQGLGYGLDEAALGSARRITFRPGTRCGKPVDATFVVAIRFSLGS